MAQHSRTTLTLFLLCTLLPQALAATPLTPLDWLVAHYRQTRKTNQLQRYRRQDDATHRTEPQSESAKMNTNLKILIGVVCSIPVLAVAMTIYYAQKKRRQNRARKEFNRTTSIVTVGNRLARKARQRMERAHLRREHDAQRWQEVERSRSSSVESASMASSRPSSGGSRNSRSSARVHPVIQDFRPRSRRPSDHSGTQPRAWAASSSSSSSSSDSDNDLDRKARAARRRRQERGRDEPTANRGRQQELEKRRRYWQQGHSSGGAYSARNRHGSPMERAELPPLPGSARQPSHRRLGKR